jgi:hypothetical protein
MRFGKIGVSPCFAVLSVVVSVTGIYNNPDTHPTDFLACRMSVPVTQFLNKRERDQNSEDEAAVAALGVVFSPYNSSSCCC